MNEDDGEEKNLDSKENRTDLLPTDQNRQINLVVNRPEEDELTIDLGNVFHNMKLKKRVYSWVLVLCLVVGICAPLLMYQMNKPELTVSSVVTLRYEVMSESDAQAIREGLKDPNEATYKAVTNLTAPDGQALDVNQITSAYVLQTALDGAGLSKPISMAALLRNIKIRTLLTEDSQRTKEALAGLADAKNADVYNRLQSARMKYQNRFVVSLTNGFKEDEGSSAKVDLTDEELRQLLNRILKVYNDYLFRTYANVSLPKDSFSMIDTDEMDLFDSLDAISTGIQELYDYCDGMRSKVKSYRSWQTGRNLNDWMETLQTFKSINVDYLFALVSEKAITRDKDALITSWKYQLRTKQNKLEEVNERIAEIKKILASYKNDEVIISMQESDTAKTTKASTEYYNRLVLEQSKHYATVASLKTSIAEYTDRIVKLENTKNTEITEEVERELERSLSSAQEIYEGIRAHMEEIYDSSMYTTYEDFSAAQGKQESFLKASAKKMIIGGVAGIIIACGLWFLSALAPEFSKGRKGARKEAAAE